MTTVAAITDAGNIIPSAHSTYNLGSNAVRWNNIYTMDMHFSNKGSQNDIDGTWGDSTKTTCLIESIVMCASTAAVVDLRLETSATTSATP